MSDDETSSNASSVDMNDLSNPDIITKYRLAGDFAAYALEGVISECKDGASVISLCQLGDQRVLEKTSAVYNKPVVVKGEKQAVEKGIAFPTSISINNVLGNFCPTTNNAPVILCNGDLVKIEIGAHVDGYIAVATHSLVVGQSQAQGRDADVIAAAQTALEAGMRLLKPGNKSAQIIDMVKKVAESYGVSPVDGVKCCNVKRFVIEASKQVINSPRPEEKQEAFEVEPNEVYALEFAFSTSEDGKVSDKEGIVHIYRRAVDVNYMLKLKAARQVFSAINTMAPSVPFSIRAIEEKVGPSTKLGLKEINEHGLLVAYPVLADKPTERVATAKATCLVLPSGVIRLAAVPHFETATEKKVTDKDLVALLQTSLKKNKKGKKKSDKKGEQGKKEEEEDTTA